MSIPKLPYNHSVSHYNMFITINYVPLLAMVNPNTTIEENNSQ